jgi:aminoglycoside phosphotransferase (APT) family kinase protein
VERLIRLPAGTLPEQSRTSIVHGDYRIDNVVFDGDGTLTAVLDWELATLGDPLADFSYLAMQWMMPADGWRGLAGCDLAALGIPTWRRSSQRYSARSGVPSPTARLVFRLQPLPPAGIVQGIKKRVMRRHGEPRRGRRNGQTRSKRTRAQRRGTSRWNAAPRRIRACRAPKVIKDND